MFETIHIEVQVADKVRFFFDEAICLQVLTVACLASEQLVWEIIDDRFRPVQVVDSAFVSVPASDIPDDLVAEFANQFARRPEPSSASILKRTCLVEYGVLPPGYREKIPPKPLPPGLYNVLLFAEEGHGAVQFEVPGAA